MHHRLKEIPLLILLCMLISCSDTSPKVYSLSEIGQLKTIYRYQSTSMTSSNSVSLTSLGFSIYVTNFTTTTLNNGAAFITLNMVSDNGNNSYSLVEYLPVKTKFTDYLIFGGGESLAVLFDLTGDLPTITMQAYQLSNAEGSPATISAPLVQ